MQFISKEYCMSIDYLPLNNKKPTLLFFEPNLKDFYGKGYAPNTCKTKAWNNYDETT